MFYHPQCPACKKFAETYKDLAKDLKAKGIPVEPVAINLSKTWEQGKKMDLKKMPTVRIFKKDGTKVNNEEPETTVENLEKKISGAGIGSKA